MSELEPTAAETEELLSLSVEELETRAAAHDQALRERAGTVEERAKAASELAELSRQVVEGERARHRRTMRIGELYRLGWTQAELAEAASMTQQAVSKALKTTPGASSLETATDTAYLIGRIFGVADWLCTYADVHHHPASPRLDALRMNTSKHFGGKSAGTHPNVLTQHRALLEKGIKSLGGAKTHLRQVVLDALEDIDARLVPPPKALVLGDRGGEQWILGFEHQRYALTRELDARRARPGESGD